MAPLKQRALADIDNALSRYHQLLATWQGQNAATADHHRVVSLFWAAIQRNAPIGQAHRTRADAMMNGAKARESATPLAALAGISLALREDIEADRLATIEELTHAEVYSDYLEMARELLGKGFKDPAAVLAGSTLESHLRKLATRASIPTTQDDGSPQKAEWLNTELRKAAIYEEGDKKQVTAWLDLKNDAAEGRDDQYEAGQVRLMVDGVQDFIRRLPA